MTPSLIRRLRYVAVLLFIGALCSAAPISAAQGLTPYDVAEIQQVSDAVLSEDGQHVAFTRSVPANPLDTNATAATHLFVLDAETGDHEALVTDRSVSSVAFRPERGTITFLASPDDEDGDVLYELPVDGGTPTRLLEHDTSVLDYEWAPDGDRVAFIAREELDRPETELPYQPEFYEEHVPHRRGFIHDVTQPDADPQRIQVDGTLYLMNWSPEGERLAISEAPTPHVDDFYMAQSVKVVAAETGEVIADINNAGKLGQIEWSPDGERLALRAGADIHDPIDGRILIADATDGATPENILPDFEGKFEQIAWTGANTIHVLASEGVERSFGTIQPDGTDLTRTLTPGGPIWTHFSRSEDGAVAFVANTPEHPGEVYWMDDGSSEPTRMTATNPWLGDVELGRQEVIRYEARDGKFEIEGLLVYPLDYTEGQRVPLIVMVHGGPEAHYSDGWITAYSQPGQVGANRGYAVFYPNYRGSTGRGVEFLKSSQGDLAGKEFDDIVDGVDYLIDQGIVDGERVGVTGGSYGGYATAWMSTYYSPRFAAGVMNVGISNNLSKWGTSDIPEELYLVHARTRIWNSWVDMLRRSPVYHVDNAQTPLLIAHGKEDTRVHPGQSLELYRHLKVRKPEVPLRHVRYPGEGHGYARSTARLDYNLRTMRWFDTYLKGDGPMPPSRLEVEEEEMAVPAGR